jgi:hypothetical protein
MQLDAPDQLGLIYLFDSTGLEQLVGLGQTRTHTLIRPGLAYVSDRVRFLEPSVDWDRFIDPRLLRLKRTTEAHREDFAAMLARYPNGTPCRLPTLGPQLFCGRFQALWEAHATLSVGLGGAPLAQLLEAYDLLRQEGVLAADPDFLAAALTYAAERLAVEPGPMQAAIETILSIHAKDELWDEARQEVTDLRERGLIPPTVHDRIIERIATVRRRHDEFVLGLRGD